MVAHLVRLKATLLRNGLRRSAVAGRRTGPRRSVRLGGGGPGRRRARGPLDPGRRGATCGRRPGRCGPRRGLVADPARGLRRRRDGRAGALLDVRRPATGPGGRTRPRRADRRPRRRDDRRRRCHRLAVVAAAARRARGPRRRRARHRPVRRRIAGAHHGARPAADAARLPRGRCGGRHPPADAPGADPQRSDRVRRRAQRRVAGDRALGRVDAVRVGVGARVRRGGGGVGRRARAPGHRRRDARVPRCALVVAACGCDGPASLCRRSHPRRGRAASPGSRRRSWVLSRRGA